MSISLPQRGSADLRTQVERVRADLPPSLATVADFALSQGEYLATLSVDQIASACRVSKATVVRFCRALGYDGLRSLKLSLIASQLARPLPAEEHVTHATGHNGLTSMDPSQLLRVIAASTLATSRIIDSAVFTKAVGLMAQARLMVWYGTGDSGFLAMSGNHRCQINGFNSKATYIPEELQALARQFTADDVLICISRSGCTASVLTPVRVVRAASSIPVIAVTGGPGSPLAELADYVLASAPIDLFVDEQRTTLQTAQMSVIDALVTAVFHTHFHTVRSTGVE